MVAAPPPPSASDATAVAATVIEAPLISLGRALCGDLDAALRREWLVTNGRGGFASGTVAGTGTRRYHGLLVAALDPPGDRTMLVTGVDEWATVGGARLPLATHEWADGTVAPAGHVYLESFELRGTLPVWTYLIEEMRIERRLWMEHGADTTYLSYHVVGSSRPVTIEVAPYCTRRGFHTLGRAGAAPAATVGLRAVALSFEQAEPYYILSDAGGFSEDGGGWYYNLRRRAETERGLDDVEDVYVPGRFRFTLWPDERATLSFSTSATPSDAAAVLAAEERRQMALLAQAGMSAASPPLQQLVLAAGQFLVERGSAAPPAPAWTVAAGPGPRPAEQPRSVIAGYHWFAEWGRDTMIALPGLALATGRATEAADVLRTYAGYLNQGLLPNQIPDGRGPVQYNSADATLWFFLALRAYEQATGDQTLVDDLLPALVEIVQWHVRGTHHGIIVDDEDGLLRCGESGVQLTWMDAKVGDWVVTPRTGKPVEINALWHAALRTLAGFCAARGHAATTEYRARADRAATGFRRFWKPYAGYLADVLDTPDGTDDLSLRPNQIFAVSLPFPLLPDDQARAVVTAVGQALLTSLGLRSLTPADRQYRPIYSGGVVERDGAYHQGTAWTWLLGPYAEAHFRVHGDRAAARAFLRPLLAHLHDAGLGSISEIADGAPPHLPRGAVAQAWSVAETLRVLRLLDGQG